MDRCITLLTDFGLKDASASVARNIVMQYNPGIPVLDITHTASGTVLTETAYLLASAYHDFPINSCHIVYTGIYYSKVPVLILCRQDDHYFLAPDNGILPLALKDNYQAWKCFELDDDVSFRDWQHICASTVQALADKDPDEIGLLPLDLADVNKKEWPVPIAADNWVDCQILHLSYNGNVVINITREYFETLRDNRSFRIDVAGLGKITSFSKHPGKVNDSELLCRFNAAGYLEIAVNGGPASDLLGFSAYSDNQRFYSSVKIFFE